MCLPSSVIVPIALAKSSMFRLLLLPYLLLYDMPFLLSLLLLLSLLYLDHLGLLSVNLYHSKYYSQVYPYISLSALKIATTFIISCKLFSNSLSLSKSSSDIYYFYLLSDFCFCQLLQMFQDLHFSFS